MGLRPVFVSPRTLVRTWGTPSARLEGTGHARFILPRVGEAGGELEGEPHTRSLPAPRSRKSGYAPVLMNKPERVHTGEQIHFPHLAKNERDMGHPQLRLGKSFETCSFLP
jgi:hypothetical protein